jgi:8-oxo-dGTP pyrophosphatase MutT (NUDIX family)
MSGDAILPAILARLATALAMPHPRYRPWRVDGETLGWIDDARARRLARFNDVFEIGDEHVAFVPSLDSTGARTRAMAGVARVLRADGELPAWRDELYAVAPRFDAPMAFALERGAARWFGVRTYAAHVNGHVVGDGAPRLWFARRSPTKAIDPGMLDNLVGGGITAGTSVLDTVVREAREEAGIPAPVSQRATAHGSVHVRRALPDGLQDETVFIHDLALAPDFTPANQDGEVAGHRLVDLATAARLIAATEGPDFVTVDASAVVLDFLLRHGAFAPDAAGFDEVLALRETLQPPP